MDCLDYLCLADKSKFNLVVYMDKSFGWNRRIVFHIYPKEKFSSEEDFQRFVKKTLGCRYETWRTFPYMTNIFVRNDEMRESYTFMIHPYNSRGERVEV